MVSIAEIVHEKQPAYLYGVRAFYLSTSVLSNVSHRFDSTPINLPIVGMILAFIMMLELIQPVMETNNMQGSTALLF